MPRLERDKNRSMRIKNKDIDTEDRHNVRQGVRKL